MAKKKIKRCAYCGIGTKEGDDAILSQQNIKFTEDHVIPQGFFNKNNPPHAYVKVPACQRCNNDIKSPHDNFLKTILALEENTHLHSDGARLISSAFNGLQFLPQSQRQTLANPVRLRQFTKSGIYLGMRSAYRLDTKAETGLKMIIQGLYYDRWKEWLPIECVTHLTNSNAAIEAFNIAIASCDPVQYGPFVVGDDVCSFVAYYAHDDHRIGVWTVQFYGSCLVTAFTDPRFHPTDPFAVDLIANEQGVMA